MGIFDKAKDLAGNADELIEQGKGLADKVPGEHGDKASELLDKAEEMKDKILGQGD